MDRTWTVVCTHSGRELWAAENIVRQGYEYYLPRVQETVSLRPGRMRLARAKPLFPRYMFVLIGEQWRCLQGTFGVCGLVMVGEDPARVAQSVIDELRSREDGSGLVVLPSRQQPRRFAKGAQVRITNGAFTGYQGIYQDSSSKERVSVLLDYLGRKTSVLIAENLLEAV